MDGYFLIFNDPKTGKRVIIECSSNESAARDMMREKADKGIRCSLWHGYRIDYFPKH